MGHEGKPSSRAIQVFLGYPFRYGGIRAAVRRAAGRRADIVVADQELWNDTILAKIRHQILSSDLALFDLTAHNPNVALELGIALGANKPALLLYGTGKTKVRGGSSMIFSDLQGRDSIRYSNYRALERQLDTLVFSRLSEVIFAPAVPGAATGDGSAIAIVSMGSELERIMRAWARLLDVNPLSSIGDIVFKVYGEGRYDEEICRQLGMLVETSRRALAQEALSGDAVSWILANGVELLSAMRFALAQSWFSQFNDLLNDRYGPVSTRYTSVDGAVGGEMPGAMLRYAVEGSAVEISVEPFLHRPAGVRRPRVKKHQPFVEHFDLYQVEPAEALRFMSRYFQTGDIAEYRRQLGMHAPGWSVR